MSQLSVGNASSISTYQGFLDSADDHAIYQSLTPLDTIGGYVDFELGEEEWNRGIAHADEKIKECSVFLAQSNSASRKVEKLPHPPFFYLRLRFRYNLNDSAQRAYLE